MGIYDLDLQELPLFEGLKADEVDQFIQATGAKVKRYGKEMRILKAYEANSRIGIIVEGEALVIAEDRFGNESVGHRLGCGALFGSTTAILPEYANPTAIEAVSDVRDPLPAAADEPLAGRLRQGAGPRAARQGARVQQERPDARDRPDEGEGAP